MDKLTMTLMVFLQYLVWDANCAPQDRDRSMLIVFGVDASIDLLFSYNVLNNCLH